MGLPKDEFTENGHLPYEIYVREARRLRGDFVFTQFDAMRAANVDRAPMAEDSIAITEWYMDSHACTSEQTRNSLADGKMNASLRHLSRPNFLQDIV